MEQHLLLILQDQLEDYKAMATVGRGAPAGGGASPLQVEHLHCRWVPTSGNTGIGLHCCVQGLVLIMAALMSLECRILLRALELSWC